MHKKKEKKEREKSENCIMPLVSTGYTRLSCLFNRHARSLLPSARKKKRLIAECRRPVINDNVEGYILRDPDLVPIARSL